MQTSSCRGVLNLAQPRHGYHRRDTLQNCCTGVLHFPPNLIAHPHNKNQRRQRPHLLHALILGWPLSVGKHISAGACLYVGDRSADGWISGLNLDLQHLHSENRYSLSLLDTRSSSRAGLYTRQDSKSIQRGIYRACQVIKL